VCLAASCVNPYGWRLHAHIFEYLNSSWILQNVQEFQSPNIRSENMLVFAMMLLAAVALVSRAGRFESALVLVWGFEAMRSARHVPFFAVAAAPVIAAECARRWRVLAQVASSRSPVRLFWEAAQELGHYRPPTLLLPTVAVAVISGAAQANAALDFPEARFPVRAVERNAAWLAPAGAMPRVLTSDQWADYLIYCVYPRQRVFFDGRSDFYGPSLGAEYRELLGAGSRWRDALARYGFERALLPRDWPLSTMLDREPGWRRVYEDPVAVLFVRAEDERSSSTEAMGWRTAP
jgi:hypothetical protein